ncbi:Ragulator complex protein Hypothetical proteinMTOR4 homolog [Nesidiocoris tenuis]|uniref:Late endosomal/lysosomal adaptor and MAPK and MTOR activator 4 n=1 Tax=Nesidiocoris tenuis TaxID=355587 RepID=A0ABN7AT03_9HEMI|nr:Ragulator complex protein Hypothetical proteinMTOR4 homolog [Nesidiocoris tenuis]
MKMFDRIPDIIGYLVLNEDGAILSSDGELENAESTANVFSAIVSLAGDFGPLGEPFTKLTLTFSDCVYSVCLSNKKLYITKQRYTPPPMPSPVEEEPPVSDES